MNDHADLHRPAPVDEGPAAAALLAAGVGAAALGVLTVLAEADTGAKAALTLDAGVGPLSGKTAYAVAAWLIAWLILHLTVGRRAALTRTVIATSAALIAVGVLGTFSPFFQMFGHS
jgi:hypothetical protein